MPLCFGAEGHASMGVLKDWAGTWKKSYYTGIIVFLKLYTGPAGQTVGILGLWPGSISKVFYLNRTSTGLEFGVNARCEFEHWSPDSCYLRDLYSYVISDVSVPANTWVNVMFGMKVGYRLGLDFIQIDNDSSPKGSRLYGDILVEWGHPDNLQSVCSSSSFFASPAYDSTSYIRAWRASPPPTCYVSDFKWFEYYAPRLPNEVTGLSAGQITGGGTKFEGAIMEVSIWSPGGIVSDTRMKLRRNPGYALEAPEHTEDGSLRAYWPLIDDGETDFQGAEQENSLTATPSGTAAFSDCYEYADDAYEPWPIEPGKRKANLTTPPRGFSLATPTRRMRLITPERSAKVVTPQRSARIITPGRTVTRDA